MKKVNRLGFYASLALLPIATLAAYLGDLAPLQFAVLIVFAISSGCFFVIRSNEE